jgi:uncharacterized protein (TIGR00369 family)
MSLGVLSHDQIASNDGLTLMQKVVSGEIAQPPYYRFLGARLAAIEQGSATVRATPQPFYHNPFGNVHGGYIATLLDMCMGCAAHTGLEAATTYATVEINLNFIRPVMCDLGELAAHGKIVHLGRNIGVIEGAIVSSTGKLLAAGRSTVVIARH